MQTSRICVLEIEDRQDEVELGRLAQPRMFSQASSATTISPPKMSSGLCLSAPSPGNALR